jgi:hypothetical protein
MGTLKASAPGLAKIKQARKEKGGVWIIPNGLRKPVEFWE